MTKRDKFLFMHCLFLQSQDLRLKSSDCRIRKVDIVKPARIEVVDVVADLVNPYNDQSASHGGLGTLRGSQRIITAIQVPIASRRQACDASL